MFAGPPTGSKGESNLQEGSKPVYIGIGTVVLIIIIVLVILMLRR